MGRNGTQWVAMGLGLSSGAIFTTLAVSSAWGQDSRLEIVDESEPSLRGGNEVLVVNSQGEVLCEGAGCQVDDIVQENRTLATRETFDFWRLPDDEVVTIYVEFKIPDVVRPPVTEYRFDRVLYMQDSAEIAMQFLEPMAEAYGVSIVSRRRLTPVAVLEGTAAALRDFAAAADLVDAAIIPEHEIGSEYNGAEIRDSVHAGDFHFGYNDGREGGRAGSRQRIAIIDDGFDCDPDGSGPDEQHDAFLDNGWSSSPPSRIIRQRRCTSSSCSINDAVVCDGSSHGTTVAWIAAGDYTDDQNGSYSWALQEERSGVSVESNLMLYGIGNPLGTSAANAVANAIEDAILNGADIINMSFYIHSTSPPASSQLCNRTWNPASLSTTLKAAADAGAIVVKSSGNEGAVGGLCNLTFPAYRSELISVGSLGTPSSLAYSSSVRESSASYGTMSLSRYGGGTLSYYPLSLMAPGTLERIASRNCGASGFCNLSSPAIGASYSAASVSGALASMRDALRTTFSTTTWGWQWMTLVKLMGDNYSGSSVAAAEYTTGPSEFAGFGRIRAHHLDTFSLGSLGNMRYNSLTLYDGSTAYVELGDPGMEPAGPHYLKAIVFAPDFDLVDVPEFRLRVQNTCTSWGGTATVHTAAPGAIHQGVTLTPSSTSGNCLRIAVQGVSIPPNGITIHVASYRYNNDPALH